MVQFKVAAIVTIALANLVSAEPPGPNAYLPPSSGYNYPPPAQPFPTPSPRPQSTRPSYPTPSRPPVTRPPSTYTPPPPVYTRPPPTFSRPPPPPPVSRPPPSYTPPRPTYGPPPTSPAYDQPNLGGAPSGGRPTHVGIEHDHGHDHHHEPGMPFDFNYAVKDDYYGTDYSHNAISDGDVVRGEYRVLLPDGRLQIVRYTADWKNGFNADVSYQGEARYPEASGSSQVGYAAPGGGY